MQINLVAEGVKFMALGMSAVFVFLILLVFVLKLQAKIFLKFAPNPKAQAYKPQNNYKQNTNQSALIAAITTALIRYKNDNKE